MTTTVKFLHKKKLKDAIMFSGLPGIGLVGKIAVDYLLKQLKAKKIAEVYSDSFPPGVYTQNGVIDLIKDEMFLFESNEKSFVFIAGPAQPALSLRNGGALEHYEFAEKVVQAAKELGVKEIYTLAGVNVGEKRLSAQPSIVVAATNKKILNESKSLVILGRSLS